MSKTYPITIKIYLKIPNELLPKQQAAPTKRRIIELDTSPTSALTTCENTVASSASDTEISDDNEQTQEPVLPREPSFRTIGVQTYDGITHCLLYINEIDDKIPQIKFRIKETNDIKDYTKLNTKKRNCKLRHESDDPNSCIDAANM